MFTLSTILTAAADVISNATVTAVGGAVLAAAVGMALVKWGVRAIPRAFKR